MKFPWGLSFVFERNPDFAFYSVYNISNFILILKDVLYCYPYSPSKSSSEINAACYFVASCLLGIPLHLPPCSLSCPCFGFPNSKWKRPAVPVKGFWEWVACKFRSSWWCETVECLEAKSISGIMNRHWSWRQERTTPVFFTNQTMFFLLLFSSFCPYLLLRMSSPFFLFLHFFFHHKMISLINLFNKYVRDAFRLLWAPRIKQWAWSYQVHTRIQAVKSGQMVAGLGNRRVIGEHLQEHLTQIWEFKEVSPKEVMVRLIPKDEYKHPDLWEGPGPDACIL